MSDLKRILELATRPETGRLGEKVLAPDASESASLTTPAPLILELRAFAQRTATRVRLCDLTLAILGMALVLGNISWAVRVGVFLAAVLVAVYARKQEDARVRAALLAHVLNDLEPQTRRTVAALAASVPPKSK